jgi:hypothetical protein
MSKIPLKYNMRNIMKHISRVATITIIGVLSNFGLAVAGSTIGINELYAEEDRPQEYCLALNMYFESRGSSVADMAGVSDVVLNRVKDSRYPDTICEVIRQGPVRESWKTKRIPTCHYQKGFIILLDTSVNLVGTVMANTIYHRIKTFGT